MNLHCLNTELNSQLSAIVDCTDQQFEELLEVYSSHTIDSFKNWFDKNYQKTMPYGELYAVHVKT